MPTNTGGGSTTSFNNTPQAKDDLFSATEDGIFSFDVMANDLGGNAKVLWSIDDTNMTDDSGNGTYDLLAKDAALVPEFSDLGARIWIDNGVIRYDSNPIDYLAVGQQVVDKFTYAIRMSNGTLSWATVYVTLTGTNDAVTITSATATGAVVEDSAQTPSPTDSNQASGTIAFTDQDLADNHTATFAADPTNTTNLGTFALGPVNEAANAASGTVGWTYTINEAAAQYLAAGQVKTEKFNVTITDGNGSTITQVITVTITGTNDAPDIRVGAGDTATASLNETDATLVASGKLTVTDVDTTDTISTSVGLTTVTGSTGGLTNAQLLAMLSVTPASGLAANTGDANNLTWNFNSSGQAFDYLAVGQSLQLTYTLTVSDGQGGTDAQTVTVTVTGTNDAVSITSATATGSVVEDSAQTPSATDSNQAAGAIAFTDADLSDTHSATFAASPSNTTSLGTFLLGSVNEAANAANGSVDWTYTINEDAAQYLAAGQVVTETYVVTIVDGNGSSITQNVTITVTGSNDNPTVSVADLNGTATEDASDPTLTDTGAMTFDDVDLTDTHITSVTPAVGNTLGGSLLASVTDPATGAGDGTVTWSYSVPNTNVQYLALGQTATETFTVRISDNNGGYIDQTVVVTITGTNDSPTVSVADLAGAVTEDSTPSTLTDSGTITFDDLDLTDTHSTNVTPAVGNTLGGTLTASVTDTATGAGDGVVTWNYTVANAATQYLALGQTATETFTIRLSDNNGGYVDQVVVVTVTGANDNPTVSVADLTGAVTEDANSPNLTDSGTITFDDLDLIDTHSTNVTPAAGNMLGGVLTASVTDSATGAGDGAVTWNYSVANAATQYLAQGQSTTETFTIRVSDNNGGYVDQVVIVTVTGTNDKPTVSVADLAGAVTEDASPTLADSGAITFDDIDLTDVHTTTVIPAAGNMVGGLLTATVTDPATGLNDGTVTWNYSVSNLATQYLALGETATESFTIRISDNNGGYVDQVVVVTITGTNDDPDIRVESGDSASAPISETDSGLVASGTLTVTDVDISDLISTTVGVTATGPTSDLTNSQLEAMLTVTPDTGLAADSGDANNLTWNFNSGGQAFNYLRAGQTLQLLYALTVDDGNGGTDVQNVTITIIGANDAPILSDTLDPVAIPELDDASAQNLDAIAGSFSVTDLDVGDTLTPSVVGSPTIELNGGSFVLPGGAAALTAVGAFSVTGATSTGGAASIGYSYDPGAANLDFLRAGDILTITYTIQVSDGAAASGQQTVTFTVTGTNDAPILSDTSDPAAALELADASAQNINAITGNFSVTDLDIGDTLDASVVGGATVMLDGNPFVLPAGAGALTAAGAFTVTDTVSNGGAVNIGYSYDPGAANLDFLSAGQSLTITYTIAVSDGAATSGLQNVTITITGANDDPTVTAADDAGGVTEDGAVSASGNIGFADVDLADIHTVDYLAGGSGYLGTFSVSVDNDSTGDGSGQIGWDFSVDNADLQYLAEGEQLVQTYTVRIEDGEGGMVDQLVTVTVTGTNDDPDIRVETGDSASALLPETNVGLSTSGSLTVIDADTADLISTVVSLTNITGNAGGLSNAQLEGMLSVTPDAGLAADPDDANNLTWNFNSGGQAFNYLSPTETLQLTYTLTVSDGQGGSDTQTVTVTIQGANDAPVLTGNLAATIDEGGAYQLTMADVNFIDPDDNSANVTFTVSGLSNGTLYVNGVAASSFSGAQLAGGLVMFVHDGSETPTAGFSISVEDGDEDTSAPAAQPFSFTVTPVNDAPVNGVPAGQSVDEDETLVFSTANGNAISITDADAGGGDVEVSLSVASGTLTLSTLAGLTVSSGANGSSAVTFQGAITAINAALQGLTYQGDLNFNGDDSLLVVTSDLGNAGSGGALGDTDSVAITVNAVNDAPVASPVTLAAIAEDSGGRLITQAELLVGVTDVDGPPPAITALSLATGGGSLIDNGNGTWTYTPALNDDSSVTFNYTASDGTLTSNSTATLDITPVNDAPVASPVTLAAVAEDSGGRLITQAELLAGVTDLDGPPAAITSLAIGTGNGSLIDNGNGTWTYTPALNDDSSVTFNYTASDGTLTSNSTATLDITPVNDAPALTGDRAASINEGGSYALTLADLNFTDPDDGAADVTFTVSGLSNGALFVNGVPQNTFTGAQLAAGLVTFTHNGSETITAGFNVSVEDGDEDASAPVAQPFSITVTPVNDAPVNTTPGGQTVNEDTVRVFSTATGNAISISDVDAASNNVEVTLSVASGTLTLGSTAGISITGGANGSSAVTIQGSQTNINNALQGLAYLGNLNFNGSDSLSIVTSDLGNVGLGGAQTDNDSIAITVNAVNDAPVVDVNGANTYVFSGPAIIVDSTIPITDVDSTQLGGATVQITGGRQAGDALNFTNQNGISGSYNSGTGLLTLTGVATLAEYQAALQSISFSSTSTSTTQRTITFQVTDTGGAASAPDTAVVNVAGDTTAPTIVSEVITSATGAQSNFLNAGDVVSVTVTMSEAVIVTGAPRLALNVGGAIVQANYASGSGSNTLVFTYTILAGQTDANGISINANALTLNGGTIRDAASNNATLTAGAVADNALFKVDTAAPTVTITAPPVANGIGNTTTVTFQFSEAVTGFDITDISSNRGTFSNLIQVDADTYTATLTRTANGSINATVTANSYSDLAGNLGPGGTSANFPAGVSGEPINLGLSAPCDDDTIVTVVIGGVPDGWVVDGGTENADGSWTIQTTEVNSLTITTSSTFAGAAVVDVMLTWVNPDGSIGSVNQLTNVEAFAAGNPIFAWSGDDTLTGSTGADMFVFSQPIGGDTIHSFDASADTIDVIGYGVDDFSELTISQTADGALITLADGQSILLDGVAVSSLTAANFAFDISPMVTNSGLLTVGDGAMLPLSGTIVNSGTISLLGDDEPTVLELIQYGITLQGGGNLVLSDSSSNLISGTLPTVTFNNVDNVISGAGQLGGGSLTLINGGTIVADGVNSLVIDTGVNAATNTGTIEATGLGGLAIIGSIVNEGTLLSDGGSMLLGGNVSGSGNVLLDGVSTVEFGAGSTNAITLDDDASGLIIFDDVDAFGGSITGLDFNDRIDLRDVAFDATTTMSYVDNGDGTGILTITDATHSVQLTLVGDYRIEDFLMSSNGQGGALLMNDVGGPLFP